MADRKDTYTVEFNAQQAIQMANQLAKAMESLGSSLTKVKTGNLSNLDKALASLDPGKINNSIKAIEQISRLNQAVSRIAKTTPPTSEIAKINNMAKAMQNATMALKSVGTSMSGMAQFISGVSEQMAGISRGFAALQTSFSSIAKLDASKLRSLITDLNQVFDPKIFNDLRGKAEAFQKGSQASLGSIQRAARSVTKITDEIRKLSNFTRSTKITGIGQDLRKQFEAFIQELNALSGLKVRDSLDPGVTKFAVNMQKSLKEVINALLPLYQVFSESQKAVGTSANFGKNLNLIIANINRAGQAGVTGVSGQALKAIRVNIMQIHQALGDLKPAMDTINAAQAALKGNFATAGAVGARAGNEIALSWGSVMRLFEAHFLRRGIYAFTTALRQSVTEAAQLIKAIGEVQTISQKLGSTGRPTGLQRGMEELYQDVRRISDIYGVTQKDVIEAGYQAISNQVQGAAESFNFLESAAKFAKAAVTSLDNSVKLLSAALQSYNISISQTDKIAAIFFKTIELGRLRADDLADDLGRSAALANQLGVSLEELSAAFATATVQGVKFRNAQTYINNIMLKLIKPTDVMREAFYNMGVNSGEAAISVYGFMGTLQKLYQIASDAPDELGELGRLFGTIRGIIGGALFKNATDLYEENLVKIRTAQESYMIAYQTIIENSGDVFLREINKVKTFFTSLGKDLIGFSSSLTTVTGGIANTVKIGIQLGSVITGLIIGFKSLNFLVNATGISLGKLTVAQEISNSVNGTTVAVSGLTSALGKLGGAVANLKSFSAGLAGVAGIIAGLIFLTTPVLRAISDASKITEEEFQKIYTKIKEQVERTTLLRTKLITDQIVIISEVANKVYRGAAQQTAEELRIVREEAAQVGDVIKSLNKSFEFSVRTTKAGIDDQQASFNEFKRTLENVIATTQSLGKEFRRTTSDLINNLKELENSYININRSVENYKTTLMEASVAQLPSDERQAVYEQAGLQELARGQQYFSAGYIKQFEKSFLTAISYFTKSKDAYIQMMQEFSGGATKFSGIDVLDFAAKLRPIEYFINQIWYSVFDTNRELLLQEFSKIWGKILYQAETLTGQAYQKVIEMIEDPLNALRRGDPEFADLAKQRLQALNEEIKQLPIYAQELAEGFRYGVIGVEDYTRGIEEVQKKLVELGQEEKQILGEVTSRQSELAKTRTNAIAAARELFKTSEQLFRQRQDATSFRERFEVDRQLVELQTRFATFERDVGYNFASEFIQTLENEKYTLERFLDDQQKRLNEYISKYFTSTEQQKQLAELNDLYKKRIDYQKEYEKLRFSDADADKDKAKALRENLAAVRTEIDELEKRNARLKEAGLLLSDQQSFIRGIEDINLRLSQAYAGENFGDVMQQYIERMRQGLKLDAELQRLQKQQQDDFKEVNENLKTLEDTTAATIDAQGELETSIGKLIGAFQTTSGLLGESKYKRFLDRTLLPESSYFQAGAPGVTAKEPALIQTNINFLRQQMAELQSDELEIRKKAADNLQTYLNKILEKIDIDLDGTLRSTGKQIISTKFNFEEFTAELEKLRGLGLADEIDLWSSTIVDSFKEPKGIKDRAAIIASAETQVRDFISKLEIAGKDIPPALTQALIALDEYAEYFETQEKRLGAFNITDEIGKILKTIAGGGESIYEKLLSDNEAALDAISKTSKDLIGELAKRAKTLGIDEDVFKLDESTGIKTIQDILTKGTEEQRSELRRLFATFGSTEEELVETQRSALTVLREIALNTSVERGKEEVITRARGGKVPNTPNLAKPYGTDSVLAALTPGEYVLRREAVQSLGISYLDALNRSGMIQKRENGGDILGERFSDSYWLKSRLEYFKNIANKKLVSYIKPEAANALTVDDLAKIYRAISMSYARNTAGVLAIQKMIGYVDPNGFAGALNEAATIADFENINIMLDKHKLRLSTGNIEPSRNIHKEVNYSPDLVIEKKVNGVFMPAASDNLKTITGEQFRISLPSKIGETAGYEAGYIIGRVEGGELTLYSGEVYYPAGDEIPTSELKPTGKLTKIGSIPIDPDGVSPEEIARLANSATKSGFKKMYAGNMAADDLIKLTALERLGKDKFITKFGEAEFNKLTPFMEQYKKIRGFTKLGYTSGGANKYFEQVNKTLRTLADPSGKGIGAKGGTVFKTGVAAKIAKMDIGQQYIGALKDFLKYPDILFDDAFSAVFEAVKGNNIETASDLINMTGDKTIIDLIETLQKQHGIDRNVLDVLIKKALALESNEDFNKAFKTINGARVKKIGVRGINRYFSNAYKDKGFENIKPSGEIDSATSGSKLSKSISEDMGAIRAKNTDYFGAGSKRGIARVSPWIKQLSDTAIEKLENVVGKKNKTPKEIEATLNTFFETELGTEYDAVRRSSYFEGITGLKKFKGGAALIGLAQGGFGFNDAIEGIWSILAPRDVTTGERLDETLKGIGFVSLLSQVAKKIPKVGKFLTLGGLGLQAMGLITAPRIEEPTVTDRITGVLKEGSQALITLAAGIGAATVGLAPTAALITGEFIGNKIDKEILSLYGEDVVPEYKARGNVLTRNYESIALLGRYASELKEILFGKGLNYKIPYSSYRYATGGQVPNTPNMAKPMGTDSVLAALTPGEFVLRKEAVQALGLPFLNMLNIQRRQNGGFIAEEDIEVVKNITGVNLAPLFTGIDEWTVDQLKKFQRTLANIEANMLNLKGVRNLSSVQNSFESIRTGVAKMLESKIGVEPSVEIVAEGVENLPDSEVSKSTIQKRIVFLYGQTLEELLRSFQQQGFAGIDPLEYISQSLVVNTPDALNNAITQAINLSPIGRHLFDIYKIKVPEQLVSYLGQQFPAFAIEGEDTPAEFLARYYGLSSLQAISDKLLKVDKPIDKEAAEAAKEGKTEAEASQELALQIVNYMDDLPNLQRRLDSNKKLYDENNQWSENARSTAEYQAVNALAKKFPNSVAPQVLANPSLFSMIPGAGDGSTVQIGRFKVKVPPGESVTINEQELAAMIKTMYYGGSFGKKLIQSVMQWTPYFKGFDLKQVQAGLYARDEFKIKRPEGIAPGITRYYGRDVDVVQMPGGISFLDKAVNYHTGAQLEGSAAERSAARIKIRDERISEIIKRRAQRIQGFIDRRENAYKAIQERNEYYQEKYESGAYDYIINNRMVLLQKAQAKEGQAFVTRMAEQSLGIRNIPESPLLSYLNEEELKKLGLTYAEGGLVAGPQLLSGLGSDTILGALTPGEYVLNKDAVSSLGTSILDGLNSGESWKEIRSRYDNGNAHSGAVRRATDVDIEMQQSEGQNNRPTMYVTAQDMNSTKVLNDVYSILRRELNGMKVDRTFLPY